MEWKDILPSLLSGTAITTIVAAIGKALGLVKFGKKEKAEVDSIRTDNDVKISKATMEWALQLVAQLERVNLLLDRERIENNNLHIYIEEMKRGFDEQVERFEKRLAASQKEMTDQKEVNNTLIEQLKLFKK